MQDKATSWVGILGGGDDLCHSQVMCAEVRGRNAALVFCCSQCWVLD